MKTRTWITLAFIVIFVGLYFFAPETLNKINQTLATLTGQPAPPPIVVDDEDNEDGEEAFDGTLAEVPLPVDLTGLPNTPGSFDTAKRLLYNEVYEGHTTTFYCGCSFNEDREVNLRSCGVKPRKNETRAARIEAEHVFPAYHFGQHRQCWREELCTKSDGSKFKGRSCCEEIDPVFKTAHNDLHNLFPAVGEINGDRSNYRWGMVEGEAREYGRCNIEVDSEIRRAEPPEAVMGDIARTYFYMEDTYKIRLSDQQRQLFEAWNKMDPVDDWERERNSRIARIQGNRNRFIDNPLQ